MKRIVIAGIVLAATLAVSSLSPAGSDDGFATAMKVASLERAIADLRRELADLDSRVGSMEVSAIIESRRLRPPRIQVKNAEAALRETVRQSSWAAARHTLADPAWQEKMGITISEASEIRVLLHGFSDKEAGR